MADTEWRYRTGTDETGPITAEELCRRFSTGALRLDVTVWCPAVGQWVSAYTIPAFRNAAASAPPSAQPVALPALRPIKPDLYLKAARASWVAPVVAISIAYSYSMGSHGTPASPSESHYAWMAVSIWSGLLVLFGFFSGVVALFGIGRPRRMNVLVQGMFGVSMSGLILLGGLLSFHVTRSVAAQSVSRAEMKAEAITSMVDYPGWLGAAKYSAGAIVVASVDDQSPVARSLLGQVTAPCSLVTITVSCTKAQSPLTLDPSSVRLLSTQGTIDALAAEDVQASLRSQATAEVQQIGQPLSITPDNKPRVALCLVPRGIDFNQVAAVTVRINDEKITIPGRIFSADEKQKRYASNRSAFDTIQ